MRFGPRKTSGYATPRAFIVASMLAVEAVRSDSLMARVATGFNHSNAMKAAVMSQAIMT